jgi:WD40 repeat protein
VPGKLACGRSENGTLLLHTPGAQQASAVLAAADGRGNEHRCLSFSPLEPGLLAATGLDASAHLWTTAGGRVEHLCLPAGKHMDPVTAVCFTHASASNVLSVSTDKQLLVWDRRAGPQGSVVQRAGLMQPLTAVTARDDGVHIATGTSSE